MSDPEKKIDGFDISKGETPESEKEAKSSEATEEISAKVEDQELSKYNIDSIEDVSPLHPFMVYVRVKPEEGEKLQTIGIPILYHEESGAAFSINTEPVPMPGFDGMFRTFINGARASDQSQDKEGSAQK